MIVTTDLKETSSCSAFSVLVRVTLMKVTDASADVNSVRQTQSVCGLSCVAMPSRRLVKHASSNFSHPH